MKLLTSLVMLAILCLAGCKDSKETLIPQNSYRMEVEDLVDSKAGMLVKRLVITAHGKRIIKFGIGDGTPDQTTASPDRQSGNDIITAEIIIVADLIDVPTSNSKSLRWLVQIKVRGTTMAGPSLYPVASTSTLEDLVSLNIQPGEHPIGEPLVLGQLKSEGILLTVE